MQGPIEKRSFAQWSMGFRAVTEGEATPGFTDFLVRREATLGAPGQSDRVLALLQSFRDRIR